MAFKLLNNVRQELDGTGTGSLDVGAALVGYQTAADAGAGDGDTFPYKIEDGASWEYGIATYSTGSPDSISRAPTASSNSGSPINASAAATLLGVVRAEDFATVATSGDYDDLSNKPTLGTAAAKDVGFFATAAQGTKADDAMPKAGGTFTGKITLDKGAAEPFAAMPANEINMANGGCQTRTLTANAAFTASMSDGDSVLLFLSGGDTYDVTSWPVASGKWTGGSPPTLTAADLLVIYQIDSTVYGHYVGSVA